MFVDCHYTYQIHGEGKYEYRIVDSDFEERVIGRAIAEDWILPQLIDVYERRNIPVMPELMRAIVYFGKHWPYYGMKQLIEKNSMHPKFEQYKNRLDKVMVLI